VIAGSVPEILAVFREKSGFIGKSRSCLIVKYRKDIPGYDASEGLSIIEDYKRNKK